MPLAVAGVIGYAGYRALYGNQPPGAVFSFITALLLAYDPARRLARSQVTLERSLVNARMIYEILDLEPQQGDAPGALALKVGAGDVRFDRVSFAYHQGTPVLDEVTFTAAPGQMVALVGPSGAGKTTVTHLVARLYDVESGAVRVGGHDVRDVTLQSLEDVVGYVTQDAHMFHDTIRANLLYARPAASEADVWAALEAAQIAALVRSLPDGLDTVVGDRGYRLSGGERQRLAIARLLLKAPAIVVLDEATAHLDSESEAAVQRALDAALEERTSLVIAHRLSTVRNADQILVLEDGRVVQSGTHASLLAEGGLYADLYATQFREDAAQVV